MVGGIAVKAAAVMHILIQLLAATAAYRRLLLSDIGIKIAGLVLSAAFYPPVMMYSVLAAAVYILTAKAALEKKR
jgi:hypothetical protein